MTSSPASFAIAPTLRRYPHRRKETLQAWDSADELILQHLRELRDRDPQAFDGRRILVVNDSFGALSTALSDLDVTAYTDSYVSFRATELNSQGRVRPWSDLDALEGLFDDVLLRLPKNLSFLEDLLCRLTHRLKPGSRLVCGYMVKHQAKAAFDLLNRLIGPTRTSLARKKARLIFADFERAPVATPYPLRIAIDGFDAPFVNASNVFSREKLDIGTRFFLEHIPQAPSYGTILDLGCGNGIVGIAAKRANPAARILMVDDSWMAIESARANYESRHGDGRAEYHWTNCFEDGAPGSVDLALCNPPFHQGTTVGDFIAWQMFRDAHRALVPGGLLRVVGNASLRYDATLRRIFGNSRIVATNPKFMIVDATR